MVIEISRREVLINLMLFKDSLLERRGFKKREGKKGRRTYRVLLNRHTGDMRFAKKISNLESHFPPKKGKRESLEDWKEVHLLVRQESGGGVEFEVLDARDSKIESKDLDPLAWRIASEMVDVLNLKAREIRTPFEGELPEEVVLEDLSSFHLMVEGESVDKLPGWMGSIDRISAEKLLQTQPIGTYLIREGDPVTFSSTDCLSETNGISVRPYVLTVVEKDLKICDLLLLETPMGWTIYQDEPILTSAMYRYYSSPQTLVQSIGPIARHPIK